jgi:hypothetical protein
MAAFNLGVFWNPTALLSIYKYETIKIKNQNDELGCIESVVFQTEMTSRDKDHVNHFDNYFVLNKKKR